VTDALPEDPPGTRHAGEPGSTRAVQIGSVAAAVVSFGLYSLIGLVRFQVGRSGNYDLGIFSQAAKAWSRGGPPASSIRGVPNLFADHVSPITAVFGLAWRIWPDPRALILVQALTLSVTVGLIAWAWLSWRTSWVVPVLLVGVVFAKGMISAAFFDVHETGLGAPLVAGLAIGLLRGERRLVWVSALALLLVKEDLGLTVMMAGGVWYLLERDRRTALGLALAGVAGIMASFTVVYLVSGQQSIYFGSLLGRSDNPLGLAAVTVGSGTRLTPVALFVLTAGVVGLRSPIALLALPTLGWRLVSSNPVYWQTYFHYDVILVPIAAIALLDVIRRSRGSHPRMLAVAGLGLAVAASMGIGKASTLPWGDRASYRLSPDLVAVTTITEQVPTGEVVAAQQELGPSLVRRLDVHMLSNASSVRTRWVVLTDTGTSLGAPQAEKQAWLAAQRARPDVTIHQEEGVVLVELPEVEDVQIPG
jgi:uncharacterized membrane protein